MSHDLIRRAVVAWFKAGGSEQPDNTSMFVDLKGKGYVLLKNVNGPLAVYRVRVVNGNQVLKRLKRWPDELNKEWRFDLPLSGSLDLSTMERLKAAEADIALLNETIKELKIVLRDRR